MGLIYAFVARHTFNFYKTTEWLYLAVADEAFGRQARAVACAGVAQRATDGVPYAYLERIAEAWEGDFARRAQRAGPHSFNRSFGPRLKEQMDFLNANPEAINRVAAVQRKVEDVKSVMVENIDKVVLRGERIQLLVEAAEELEASANQFRKQGRALRQQFWWQNVKTKVAVVGGISLILAFILVFCICFAGANRCVPNKTGR
ncbi:Vesicle-associated membrane protein [Monoraphidium neglectum]|uniref:Vesicle-associated membrane protein n=1 Tax=Monoraphidium neglectum TaxID=145388 RepID=A0A0D2J649_9CHLO|nr:Vesicle-associated membrane protein [Monoraphidium neglectum]KIY95362.1 Vesicle-associated membrane protein [Monoraphidium neglectum]|eukprot:XP_013894382.1 Vesicle-associated membrane protein [Monoraphidium neglectum]